MKTKNLKKIGVLGGMGPLASANFYQKLIELAQKKYGAIQDADFPEMIIYNLALKDFDETGITAGASVLKQLVLAAKRLQIAGSDFIVIPCNTVHAFYPQMKDAVSIPVLNLIELSAQKIIGDACQNVGLMASATTCRLGLYQKTLGQKGIKVLNVSNCQQKIIDEVVLKVMAGKNRMAETEKLQLIINDLKNQGAKAVILGCTELPLAISQKDCPLPLFDTLEILTNAALDFAFG